jgi:hypothetical protein
MKDYLYKEFNQIPEEMMQKIVSFVNNIPEEEWTSFEKPKNNFKGIFYDVICLLNKSDKQNSVYNVEIINQKYLKMFDEVLRFVNNTLYKEYPDGEFTRVVLHRLSPKYNINPHEDVGYHLENCRRVHLPIITDENVVFLVKNIKVPMNVGFLTEINNNVNHSVLNNSNASRVHLIMDWSKKNDPYYTK